jgi:hypothetical protein
MFRVESVVLRSHWVLLVMDIFIRRIIGFGLPHMHRWPVGVPNVHAATTAQCKPRYLSTDQIRFSAFTVGSPTCA